MAFEGLKKFTNRFSESEEDDEVYEETDVEKAQPIKPASSSPNKVFTYSASTTLHLVVCRPKKFSDGAEIAELYKKKNTVILMLDNTNKDTVTRLIDFLGGITYITDGVIRRIGDTTFVVAPINVDISGELIDEINSISGEDIFNDLD